jgi:hypothetical protein
MMATNDIDANGYWTIDNYESLMGLWAYRWLAQQVGDTAEVSWATAQYNRRLLRPATRAGGSGRRPGPAAGG